MPRLTPTEWSDLQKKYDPKTLEGMVSREGGGISLKEENQPQPQSYADFINEAFRSPELIEANNNVNTTLAALQKLQEQSPNFLANKEKELMAADPRLQTLNRERQKYYGEAYAAPMQAREQYKDIFDPVQREALVSASVAQSMGKLSGTGELITERRGRATDLAEQAQNLLQAQIESMSGAVTQATSTRDTIRTLLKDIASKGYEATVKEKERVQDIEDEMSMYLFKEQNKSYAPKSGGETFDAGEASSYLDFVVGQIAEDGTIDPSVLSLVPQKYRAAVMAGLNSFQGGEAETPTGPQVGQYDTSTGELITEDTITNDRSGMDEELVKIYADLKKPGASARRNYQQLLDRKKEIEDTLYGGQTLNPT